jgi:hypothetical protein
METMVRELEVSAPSRDTLAVLPVSEQWYIGSTCGRRKTWEGAVTRLKPASL